MKKYLIALTLLFCSLGAIAQNGSPQDHSTLQPRIVLVTRTTHAVNYRHGSYSTKVDFKGTSFLPDAGGNAEVKSKQGAIQIEAEFTGLQSAGRFGPEYLTYVLWAISPEGRPVNLGEVLLNHSGKSKLNVTSNLQTFALIVTAEPYFAVTQPSDVVVMENELRSDTKGKVEQVDAKFELLQRGLYESDINPADLQPLKGDSKTPLELYQARNAVRIAKWTGAEKYASDTLHKSQETLKNAEVFQGGDGNRKQEISLAREAVQTAEDARVITIKKMTEERHMRERQASIDSANRSNARADDATRDKEIAQSESAQAKSDMATHDARNANDMRDSADAQARSRSQADEANREKDVAQTESAQAKSDMTQSEANSAEANRQKQLAQNESAQAKSDMTQNQTNSARELAASQADANQSRSAAQLSDQKAQASDQRAQASDQRAQTAEGDKAAMRAKLEAQLNSILQTRDSARGLIVSMSDVLFNTGQYTLMPGAREKLAKVAGILLSYPGLNIAVAGYTDNVGASTFNQRLSEQRAGAVRDYLVTNGVAANSVTATGYGNSQPVASNNDASGRQANRRVELVVSGEAIGQHTVTSSRN
jgi:outer membrane protein OmpA-like peptidoglycan-associated protein